MKKTLRNFADVELALRPYIPLVKELTGKDTVFDRIVPLMEYLGHPENELKTIHLAGTSGKTSTAYYVASLLTLAGNNVGLTVSPHVDTISERTQINGEPLEESVFAEKLEEFLDLIEASNIKPSYFELIYAFSIWLFAKLKVDYAVIETGLGGLYDATNVVNREDKVCVITDIGFDHMHILGYTLKEITAQKVGIVHEHNSLLMYKQGPEIMPVVESWIHDKHAELHLTNQKTEEENYGHGAAFKALPDYQKRNWLLAYYVYRFVRDKDALKDLVDEELAKSQRVVIPARMDISEIQGHLMIMDGAHNYQKMAAFVSSYKHKFPGDKPAILLAFKSDKIYPEVLPLLIDMANEIILTTFNKTLDLPATSCPPEELAAELRKLGFDNIKIEADNLKAYKMLLNSPAKNLVITGSFYLIAQVRDKLRV